ncbi:MAG TPA: hypothetical protein VGM64_13115 [Lacunisphaera sp.]|jgi:hypothetical protein
MYPKTERALRFSFGFFGSLYGIIFLGYAAQIALVFLQDSSPRWSGISGVFILASLFFLLVTSSFFYVVVRFQYLLAKRSQVMAWALHFSFFGQFAFLTFQYFSGLRHFNSLGGIIAMAVYAALLSGVKKLMSEQLIEDAANHPPESTRRAVH